MIIIIISFILDNVIASLINFDSLMYPLFSILSLILTYNHFNQRDNFYFIVSFILGLIYDIAYTDTVFLNAFIFLLLAYLLRKAFTKIVYNYLSVLLISISTIIYYRLITYIILVIVKYINFNFLFLLKGIYSSLIINFIYISVVYLINNSKKIIFKKH